MRPQPYIGITGFTSPKDVQQAMDIFESIGAGSPLSHKGMAGFLVTDDLLEGKAAATARRIADASTLIRCLQEVRDIAIPMIHYELFDEQHGLTGRIHALIDLTDSKPLLSAVQLNGTPSPAAVLELQQEFSDLAIVSQLRPELMAQGIEAVVSYIHSCRGAIHHALIDPSCGRGQAFDVTEAASMYIRLSTEFPDIAFGFAGGFSGNNVYDRTRSLSKMLGNNDFSIDAEGQLRDDTDTLELSKVEKYIYEAARSLSADR